ncbi:MAG: hypothetical protein HLUCCA12_12480 [Rhodobacteraceae bacterium HLUCCA12]|nr:MAG: hypothetical protein HLUCCA12_12480 [Rhodobacteraceae bacterium HLUCCA12]
MTGLHDIVVTRTGARFMGRQFPCATGRGGITRHKREGDGATPAGSHAVTGLHFRPDRISRRALPIWARPIRPGDLWSDDPMAPDYNHLTRAPYPFGHERLRRADPLYDLVVTTDWNWPNAQPGAGSAIFVHIWRAPRYPTAGCVAFARHDFLWIVNRLTPDARLIIQG